MLKEGRNMSLEDDFQMWVLLLAAMNIHVLLAVRFPRYAVS